MSNIATSRILCAPESGRSTSPACNRSGWVWPLPRLDGTAPCLLSPFRVRLPDSIELGYWGRSPSLDLVPVFAAQDGTIAYAGADHGTSTLCIDHAGGWSTQYSELAHVLARPTDRFRRRRKERVRAGDVVGHAPRASSRVRFALSHVTNEACLIVDPTERMATWSILPWFTKEASASQSSRTA